MPQSKIATTDVSSRFEYAPSIRLGAASSEYPVSVCSVQGLRPDMQDYFVVQNDFAAIFDGHGGASVSRYLRMNLYANLQAALPMVIRTRPQLDDTNGTVDNATVTDAVGVESKSSNASVSNETVSDTLTEPTSKGAPPPRSGAATVDDYEAALELALEKVDREVQKIHHWSFQGSTVVACWFHHFQDESETTTDLGAAARVDSVTDDGHDPNHVAPTDTEVGSGAASSKLTNPTQTITTIITANLGDSRAVLCRNGTALELTRDHKPSDPFENERIHRVGGTVVWSGQIDRHDQPVPGTGEFRINKSLSLSRAIGDRAERPVVSGEPEISIVRLVDEDEFLLLATDGLWDVMSSSDAVAYVRALLENAMEDAAMERDTIAALLVEEALRRNSGDNITVIIVWIQKTGQMRPKKYWI